MRYVFATSAAVTSNDAGAKRVKGGWRACVGSRYCCRPCRPAQPTTDSGAEVVVHALGLVDVPYRTVAARRPALIAAVSSGMSSVSRPGWRCRAADEMAGWAKRWPGPTWPWGSRVLQHLGRGYSHVGIYVGKVSLSTPPAPRRVRVDRLSDPYWTPLQRARRLSGVVSRRLPPRRGPSRRGCRRWPLGLTRHALSVKARDLTLT